MALAAIPVIYTLTEDALSAVPKTYMEASLGLGASLQANSIQRNSACRHTGHICCGITGNRTCIR